MGNISVEEIQKKDITSKVQEVRDKGGRLVAINGYVDKDKKNVVVYTLEYDDIRRHYHVKGEEILPTVTNIYKGAQWFEEEIQEMMPLKFEGLIFSGRLFLPEEFKDGEGQILIMPLNELKKLKDN
ncbi:NADH-quinone oxidoreductase subunit C [Clostridioides difficile]